MKTLDDGRPNLEVRVVKRAQGVSTPDVFQVREAPMPTLPPGGLVVRVLYSAVDPAMRGWLSEEKNYMTVPDGAVMTARGVAVVMQSDAPGWLVGDHVHGSLGWRRYAAVDPGEVERIDVSLAPPSVWLGVLGLNGLTAWIGLRLMGGLRAGETVLVSTAAGGVGEVVGQLGAAGAAGGCRMVGLVGSDAKVEIAVCELGCAAAINYKSDGLLEAIGAACPEGIHAFFDNTGGWIADAVFAHLKENARVLQCGTAATATWLPTPTGPRRERAMLVKRLTWRGFVVLDHCDMYPDALAALAGAYASGTLRSREEVLDGLEQAPGAIQRLYQGANEGRLLIRP